MTQIVLEYPFNDPSNPSSRITCLTLRRPKVADQLAVENLSLAMQEITMFSNLAEVSPEVIKNMDMADYNKVQEAYKSFLSPSKQKS